MNYTTNDETDIIWKHPLKKPIEKTPEYYQAMEMLLYAIFDEPYKGNKDLKPMEVTNDEK